MTTSEDRVAILRSGETQPEQREMAKDPRLIWRLFQRLLREGRPLQASYKAGVSGYDLHRQITACGVRCEAGWHSRHRPTLATPCASGRRGNHPPSSGMLIRRAKQRLHRRYRHLVLTHRKRPAVVVVALARELAGLLWPAMTQQVAAA